MKKVLRQLSWVLLIVAVGAGLTWGFWPAPLELDVVTASRGSLRVTVNEDGKTRIREKFVVSAPVSGKLLRLELHAGDEVHIGETILAVIEPSDPSLLDPRARTEAKARVRAAEASKLRAQEILKKAKESHELAKREYDRHVKAFERGAVPESQFDAVKYKERIAAADVRSAEFGLKVAQFEVELAKAALIRIAPVESSGDRAAATMMIRAPVSGRVLRVFQESASVVQPGTNILELGDPRDLEMEIDVLSTDAVRIQKGAKVEVRHWGGQGLLHGIVKVVEPSAYLKVSALGVEEQRVNVIAEFTDPLKRRKQLGDGYRIEARIVVSHAKDVVKVPSGVLFREGNEWYVFRVLEGRAQKRCVVIGATDGLETVILEGVSVGDDLVLHPTDKVVDGVAVKRN